MADLLYTIKANTPKEELVTLLREHPEIKFVSLIGIDMASNDTDEKIPIRLFLKDMDDFYSGRAVQTDGSSVVLPGIASINNAKVDIPIDPTLSVADNANKYFDRYGKLKRTAQAVQEQLIEAQTEYDHLESVLTELSIARREEDLIAIRKELTDQGYLKRTGGNKGKQKKLPKSEPLHFISSDGFDIYVGKNNY